MDNEQKKYILENATKQKPEEIARILGLKEKHIRREIERQAYKQRLAAPGQELYTLVLPEKKSLLLVFFLLATLIGAIYSNTLQAPYQLDDYAQLSGNKALQNPSNLLAIWRYGSGRFLPNLTFALNYYFGGENVLGYHLVNISIHIVTSFMVYLFALALFQTPRLRNHPLSEHAKTIALLSGLFFASHPIQIQAVTYIVQRQASFAALFYVTTCFLYLSSRLKRSKKLYLAAVLFCAASMFTKQIVVTLPATIFLCEFFLFSRDSHCSFGSCLARLVPFLMMMAIIPFFDFQLVHGQPGQVIRPAADARSLGRLPYLYTQFNVIVAYLRLLFWPYGSTLYHSFPFSRTLMEPKTLLSLGLLVTLFLTAFGLRKKQPSFAFGIFWFFLTLTVESSIFPIKHVMFEHRMYLPMAGLCLAFSTIMVAVIKKRKILVVTSAFLLLALCVTTYKKNEVWKTGEGLMDEALKIQKHL